MRSTTNSFFLVLCIGCTPAAFDAPSELSDGNKIRYGSYRNDAEPRLNEFVTLTLSEAPEADLPPNHDGAYEVSWLGSSGPIDSEGTFNVYRRNGVNWIRFVDSGEGQETTPQEKYEWVYIQNLFVLGYGDDDEMVLVSSDLRSMSCKVLEVLDDGVYFEEGLSVDEYSSVSVEYNVRTEQVSATIGAFKTRNSDDDYVVRNESGARQVTTVRRSEDDDDIIITGPLTGKGRGRIDVKFRSSGETKKIATLQCANSGGE